METPRFNLDHGLISVSRCKLIFLDKDDNEVCVYIEDVNDDGKPPTIEVHDDFGDKYPYLSEEEEKGFIESTMELIKQGKILIPHMIVLNPVTGDVENDENMWIN